MVCRGGVCAIGENRVSLLRVVTLLATLNLPVVCWAQDKNAVRAQAAAAAAQLRSFGEPKDRCTIGALVVDGPTIGRAIAATPLMPGDKLLLLNHTDVSAMSTGSVIELLRRTDATATIPATVERAGARVDLQLACVNARAANTALLSALDAASTENFNDCVTALDGRGEFGASRAVTKFQCASVSRNKKRYDIGQLAYEVMRPQVEDAVWAPATQADVLMRLRGIEGLISDGGRAARYQELVALTQKWKGGENAYAQSALALLTAAQNPVGLSPAASSGFERSLLSGARLNAGTSDDGRIVLTKSRRALASITSSDNHPGPRL